jgi:hypothetical protein
MHRSPRYAHDTRCRTKPHSSVRYHLTPRPKVLERLTNVGARLFLLSVAGAEFSYFVKPVQALLACGWSGEGVGDMFTLQAAKVVGLNTPRHGSNGRMD